MKRNFLNSLSILTLCVTIVGCRNRGVAADSELSTVSAHLDKFVKSQRASVIGEEDNGEGF